MYSWEMTKFRKYRRVNKSKKKPIIKKVEWKIIRWRTEANKRNIVCRWIREKNVLSPTRYSYQSVG